MALESDNNNVDTSDLDPETLLKLKEVAEWFDLDLQQVIKLHKQETLFGNRHNHESYPRRITAFVNEDTFQKIAFTKLILNMSYSQVLRVGSQKYPLPKEKK